MYTQRPNEFPFSLGERRAFVNPPTEVPVNSDQFVYNADGAIRISREALLGHYDIVLREVVRFSRLQREYVNEVLQQVVHKVRAQR